MRVVVPLAVVIEANVTEREAVPMVQAWLDWIEGRLPVRTWSGLRRWDVRGVELVRPAGEGRIEVPCRNGP